METQAFGLAEVCTSENGTSLRGRFPYGERVYYGKVESAGEALKQKLTFMIIGNCDLVVDASNQGTREHNSGWRHWESFFSTCLPAEPRL